MLFYVEVHTKASYLSRIGKYIVLANDVVAASGKALKVAQKDNPDEKVKDLYVKIANELDGQFVK